MRNLDHTQQRQHSGKLPIKALLARNAPTNALAFAVSVFDSWLGPVRYHELACSPAEQVRRNDAHNAFCRSLRELHEVFAVRRRGRNRTKRLVLREFSSADEYDQYVDAHDDRPSAKFFVLAIPALGVIYEQHWDDTNIAWFVSEQEAANFRRLVKDADLHALEFEG